jgi:hypothetical protein
VLTLRVGAGNANATAVTRRIVGRADRFDPRPARQHQRRSSDVSIFVEDDMRIRHALSLALFLGLATPLTAGQVPIHGVTGTIALPDSVEKFYSGVNKTLVKTKDGIDHITGKKNATTPDAEAASLDTLQPGTAVVVHYMVKGIRASADPIDSGGRNGVRPNEGIVTHIDRHRNHITIRLADGTTETLRLTHNNADNSNTRRSRIVVYYADASGRKVAQYFKRVTSQ